MDQTDYLIFVQLYREAYAQCFNQQLQQALSETESKLFYNTILDQTGLAVGWRSLKNYSFYVLDKTGVKTENPSLATLDTLARYVLKAPYTNEINRKNEDSHHPYWFLYRANELKKPKPKKGKNSRSLTFVLLIAVLLIGVVIYYLIGRRPQQISFTDDFTQLDDAALNAGGWQVLDKDSVYWNKRKGIKNTLTVFTLPGDNWPDSAITPSIKNLLIRKLPAGCSVTELQLDNFVPAAEWQQAGLLLMADSSINSASIRLSLAYNDFFGGYKRSKEIIVQAISAPGQAAKPEEFIHYPVLAIDSAVKMPVLLNNLKHTALRIEKQGNHYRFLYAGGMTANTSFKELASKDILFEPKYVAIFALKGNVNTSPIVPVRIRMFKLNNLPCE